MATMCSKNRFSVLRWMLTEEAEKVKAKKNLRPKTEAVEKARRRLEGMNGNRKP